MNLYVHKDITVLTDINNIDATFVYTKEMGEIFDDNQASMGNFSGSNGQDFDFSFLPTQDGNYFIEIKECGNDFNGEEQYILTVNCDIIDAVNNVSNQNNITISPNPFQQQINLDFKNKNNQETQISIFDITGKQRLSNTWKNTNPINIETTDWQKGIYFIQIQTEESTITRKVIKQ